MESLRQNYNITKLRFDWKESIVIYVEFDNIFDHNKFLKHSYILKENTRTTFRLILEHVNEIRLDNPKIEIRFPTMSSK